MSVPKSWEEYRREPKCIHLSRFTNSVPDVAIASERLCRLCTSLDFGCLDRNSQKLAATALDQNEPSRGEEGAFLKHQPSFAALANATGEGCAFCSLLYAHLIKIRQEKAASDDKQYSEAKVAKILLAEDLDYNDCYTIYWFTETEKLLYSRRRTNFTSDDLIPAIPLLSLSGKNDRFEPRPIPPLPPLELFVQVVNDCTTTHAICPARFDVPLPRRLIHIGQPGAENPRLVETAGKTGSYATLTHVWGASQSFVTLSSNISRHVSGIPTTTLPKTFQDALLVTRALALEYVWIDCLCIVQDDRRDWEEQCVVMDQIYENSAITIVAMDGHTSQDGFLGRRPDSVLQVCRLPNHSGDGDLLAGRERPVDIGYCRRHSAVGGRGWALQEMLLSPRRLYFGDHGMFFECKTHAVQESRWLAQKPGVQALPERASGLDSDFLLRRWYNTVFDYSYCALSKPSDKLPAFSGIARRFSKLLQDTYFAGLWRKDFLVGLSWQVLDRKHLAPRPREYRAPTWSWASVDQRNHCIQGQTLGKYRTGMEARATVLGASTTPLGRDIFGEVSAGEVKLCAPSLSMFPNKDLSDDEGQKTYSVSLSSDSARLVGRLRFDTADDELAYDNEPWRPFICVLLFQTSKASDADGLVLNWQGLALREAEEGKQVYRRIGHVCSPYSRSNRGDAYDGNAAGWHNAPIRTLTIV